jgi:hypothetical protein
MAVLKVQAWPAFVPLFFVFMNTGSLPAGSQSVFTDNKEKIPLLISDHHADHGPFMIRHLGGSDSHVCMVILDAHTDTVQNNPPDIPGNHNWISPLYPIPLEALIWIHTIFGFPNANSGKVRGFYLSVSQWGSGDPPLNALAISLDRIFQIALSPTDLPDKSDAGPSLFVSIDLDFFCTENNNPADIPFVFDTLFDFSSRWQGKVIWALALSRPWLPDDGYAWELLRQSLRWFNDRAEFAMPELTLFTAQREDTSAKARSYREKGLALPSFYGREDEMPDDIRELFENISTKKKE